MLAELSIGVCEAVACQEKLPGECTLLKMNINVLTGAAEVGVIGVFNPLYASSTQFHSKYVVK
jgi:hypothetical protein